MRFIRQQRFLRVKIDMVTRCQLRCIMCHFARPDFQVDHTTMSDDLLQKVAADIFPRAHDVTLSSSAEPLLAPNLNLALDLCTKYCVPSFHFSTNGIALNEDIVDKCIDVKMRVLTISVDAATKETFEAIRPPAKWDWLMSRFDLIRERKRMKKSEFPALSVTAVLMRRNIHEMPDLVRLMKKKGVSYMNFTHIVDLKAPDFENETLMNSPKLCNDTLAEVQKVADEEGIAVALPPPMRDKISDVPILSEDDTQTLESHSIGEFINQKNRVFILAVKEKVHHKRLCYFPWYYIHVIPSGMVWPCGCWLEYTFFGSFVTQTFREIWTGEKYRKLRNQIIKMKLRDTCANCAIMDMAWLATKKGILSSS